MEQNKTIKIDEFILEGIAEIVDNNIRKSNKKIVPEDIVDRYIKTEKTEASI